MIVREDADGRLVLVRQADHAVLSGQLAALWGAGPWSEPRPRDSVVVAARLHDLAWVPFDEQLPRRPDGRPYSFSEVSRAVVTSLYRRGIDAVEAMDPYAGLLCSLHFTGFYVSHWGWPSIASVAGLPTDEADAIVEFLDTEKTRQGRLGDRLGLGPAASRDLACAYKWLQLWDRISLDACRRNFDGWETEYPAAPVSSSPEAAQVTLRIRLDRGGVCRLDPYPLRTRPWSARVPAVVVEPGVDRWRAWLEGGSGGIEITFE